MVAEAERLGCKPEDVPGIASFPSSLLSEKSCAAQEVRLQEWKVGDMRREEMHKAARVEEAGAGREEAARVEEAAAPKESIAKMERRRQRRMMKQHEAAPAEAAGADRGGSTSGGSRGSRGCSTNRGSSKEH